MEDHSLGRLNDIVFTEDGSQVVVGAEKNTVQFWALADGAVAENYHLPAGHVDSVTLSPDGMTLAAGLSSSLSLGVWADPIQLWDLTENAPFSTLDTDDDFVTTCGIFWNNAAFSQDGAYVATSTFAHKALLWRLEDHALLQEFEGHDSAILDLALSPDGTFIATASNDEEVRVWETATGELHHTLPDHSGGAMAVTFSPDGAGLATRSTLGDVRLWRLGDDDPYRILTDVRNPRSHLAFSPDGTLLATGARNNATYLWDVMDGESLYILEGHNGLVNGVAFSPDGSQLATASDAGTVGIWALP